MTHPVEGLKPGSSILRDKYWGLMRFDRFDDSERRAFLTGLSDGQVRLLVPADMEYIGEQDAEGWIPWTGGENPVPRMDVIVRFGDGEESETLDSGCFDWSVPFIVGVPDCDIIAFRPVSTKPQGGDQGALQAQAPSVPTEAGDAGVLALRALRLHDQYLAVPQDRGGPSGPKGRAHQAWLDAKSAAIAKGGAS